MTRIAKSLDVLRTQFNTRFPGRSKVNDGWIGDAAHASRASDHNPDKNGVVKALDITHDPKSGLDARKFAEALVASRDSRISYLISNAEIVSSTVSPWKWRKYNGSNPHRAHFHISVVADPKLYDSTREWSIGGVTVVKRPEAPETVKVINPKPLIKPTSEIKVTKKVEAEVASSSLWARFFGALSSLFSK